MIRTINDPPIMGFLHEPEGIATAGLVLTHGAGANCTSALLVNIATALANAGWAVLRCDLPFRQNRKFGPPSPAHSAADREGLQAALRHMQLRIASQVFLGGHSYGGRQASMVAAEHPSDVPGLLLLSYPLHPPKKPEQLRTAHFKNLQAPCLFVQGASDPFGSPEELRTAVTQIPGKAQLLLLEGLGHDLGKGTTQVVSRIAEEWTKFVAF